MYNYTLNVALVLNDPFVVRNASAPGGYSGFSVAVMQLMASVMGAKLSFYEVPFGAKLIGVDTQQKHASVHILTNLIRNFAKLKFYIVAVRVLEISYIASYLSSQMDQ